MFCLLEKHHIRGTDSLRRHSMFPINSDFDEVSSMSEHGEIKGTTWNTASEEFMGRVLVFVLYISRYPPYPHIQLPMGSGFLDKKKKKACPWRATAAKGGGGGGGGAADEERGWGWKVEVETEGDVAVQDKPGAEGNLIRVNTHASILEPPPPTVCIFLRSGPFCFLWLMWLTWLDFYYQKQELPLSFPPIHEW